MERNRKWARGFTLIELLVVIAIIAIVAAILFPVFAQAREKARATVCLSNCKQLGTGIHMYIQDYDELLPFQSFGQQGTSYWSGNILWKDVILPYVRNRDIFKCPSNPKANDNDNYGWPISYGINHYLAKQPQTAPGVVNTPIALAQIPEPADTIFLTETRDKSYGHFGAGIYFLEQGDFYRQDGKAWQHHQSLVDCVYVDGHAKLMKIANTVQPKWQWSWTTPKYPISQYLAWLPPELR